MGFTNYYIGESSITLVQLRNKLYLQAVLIFSSQRNFHQKKLSKREKITNTTKYIIKKKCRDGMGVLYNDVQITIFKSGGHLSLFSQR